MFELQRLASASLSRVAGGHNLNLVLAQLWAAHPSLSSQERATISDLCYGTLRFGMQLEVVLKRLLKAPLHDAALRWLLLAALYQLQYTKAAPYAVVDHAVRAAARLRLPQSGGLVNAVLRNFLRDKPSLLTAATRSEEGRYAYPKWWIDKLRAQMPHDYAAVLEAGNLHPPFTLRVNRRRTTPTAYLQLLAQHEIPARAVENDGVMLAHALPVERLPGFAEGTVSVQDAAAQLAGPLLDAQNGMRVLDACAAPGGKTTHLLELADIQLTALDHDSVRLKRIDQNLTRLKLAASLRAADANDTAVWWDGRPFERILADVPCSAVGVVRRHPDIKWLRRKSDIAQFAREQARLLESLWPLLASGGKLLYTTCSIFEEENALQIGAFLSSHADARTLPLPTVPTWPGLSPGLLLPNNEHDGFFYALLQKT